MRIKIFPIFLCIIFFIIFLVFYKGLQNSNIYIPENNIKQNIPTFSTKIFNKDKEIRSDDIFKKEKFYLINIWASWCVPCRAEHSFLMNLSNQNNLTVIGLNYKDNSDNAKNFLKELGNPYDVIFQDKDGTVAIEWGAYGVPESFLIYNKKIIKKFIGPLDETLLREIKKIIE
jgi:cytochrome c biogenesis protein CcmG/thiol:disulfide interchange protein DsbE